mgnify:FL=1
MKTPEQLLADYGQSLDLKMPLTVEALITSHRYLRSLNVDEGSLRNKRINEAVAVAKAAAYEHVLKGEYIKVSDLAKMTMGEISELIENVQY